MILVKKAVEKAYTLLFPDYGSEITQSFKFKFFVVLLALLMLSSAMFTIFFIKD